jgi:Domain of Unknown Function (DUF928)
MKRILIVLLLIVTFSWLPIPEITQTARAMTFGLDGLTPLLIPNSKNIFIFAATSGIGDSFEGRSGYPNQPTKQRSAGSRSSCPSSSTNDNLTLIPLRPIPQKLMPKIKDNSIWLEPPITLTTKGNPTFGFYISEPLTSDKKAEFMLLDKNYNYAIDKPILIDISPADFYEKTKPLFFTLKDKPLKDGLYHWFFTIICDVQQPSRNQNFEGWIEKVPVSKELKAQLAEASEVQQIEIYFEKKIWHEFVDLIAQKQQDIPNEKITLNQKSYTIGEVWNQILTEVGL